MRAVVYVNGLITPAAEAVVPVFDHGFLYGEGIYETLRTYRGRPFLFDRHMARLRQSAALLRLDVPMSDANLLAHVDSTLAASGIGDGPGDEDAYIRILFTRGVGELSYEPSACPAPTLVIIVKALARLTGATFTNGIRVALVSVRRNHPSALNPLIKSNNLLNNAMAMQEALRAGAAEALMLNHDGEITECAQSNFFLVTRGVAVTPPISAGLLPGITRAFVLEIARGAGIDAREGRLTPADLETADEAFLTGTTREITPIVAVDGRPIGSGARGPVTARLQAAFRERIGQSAAAGV